MKQELTVGQFIAICSTFIIAIATGWITMSNKVAAMAERVQYLENEQRQFRLDYTKAFDELKWKIEDGNTKITQILITLEKKANKK